MALEQYRNFDAQDFTFAPQGALIIGENGSGKTNILEAINYCAFGKSVRNSFDEELIGFSKAYFRIVAAFSSGEESRKITAAYDKKRKVVTCNDVTLDRISELYRYIRTVYFSPEDIGIISGAPTMRRTFLDQAISQYAFLYLQEYRRFFRVLKQRNALLKKELSFQEKKAWDREFIESSAIIYQNRQEYLTSFIPLLCEKYHEISGGAETVTVQYKHAFPCRDGDDYIGQLTAYLASVEEREWEAQRTLCGPHLDDLIFFLDGHNMRRFGSQGQKRSLAIAARLTQAMLILERNQDPPILMFDDVLADLDNHRAANIIQMLTGDHQIFIATPHPGGYTDFQLPIINLDKTL